MKSAVTNPMLPFMYQIQENHRETLDTSTLVLKPIPGGKPMQFKPGQFNMLYAYGIGEVPISISGDTSDTSQLVHTIRDVGAVTKALIEMHKGAFVGVRGPFGRPWPIEQSEGYDILLVTGGIGLAPLRPVIYHILEQREKYGRFVLLYGTRNPENILYRKELEKWSARLDVEVRFTVDSSTPKWRGNVGVVTTLIPGAAIDPEKCIAMVCGPEIMMRFTVIELKNRGFTDDRIYLSMERNMKCGIGLCGHCQLGPEFICKDGPVFTNEEIRGWFSRREA